jgi:signal peptidase II
MRGDHPFFGVAFAGLALAVDQATKALALEFAAELERPLELLPVLNLVLVRNEGVSFGLFGAVPWWGLAAFSVVVMVGFGVWLIRAANKLVAASLGLIIGGAAGNVIDRFRHQAVTDFLDFHVSSYHWPAFNLADAAIFVGVGLYLIDSFRGPVETEQKRRLT